MISLLAGKDRILVLLDGDIVHTCIFAPIMGPDDHLLLGAIANDLSHVLLGLTLAKGDA